jgi:sodium pump decarboxylase gamma subunit
LNSDFSNGLMVSVIGIVITFTALLIFVGVIYLLKAIFPYKEEQIEEDEKGEAPAETAERADDLELTAAIAAVTYLRAHRSSQLGSALVEGKSSFWTPE